MLILYVLLGFMIIGSIIAVETRDLLSSVISVGVVGFLLSVVFLMLGAPDIAITQVVVEIIALVILIRATVVRDDTTYYTYHDIFAVASILIFFGIFISIAWYAYRDLSPFGEPLMKVSEKYVETGLKETGAANLVTSVLLDFRGYDTLGEATVLFTSIIGAFAVLRHIGRKRAAENTEEEEHE